MIPKSLERHPLQPLPAEPSHPEAEAEAAARVAREETVLKKAEADIAAGRGIDGAALEDWLESLDRDPAASIPTTNDASAGH